MRDLVRLKIYSVANFAKVEAYWKIGKKYCRKARQPYAKYGTSLLKELSE